MATPTQYLRKATVIVHSKCFYCGAKSKHADHIIALSEGGEDSAGNLIGSCAKCNCAKGARRLSEAVEMAAKQEAFVYSVLVTMLAEKLYFDARSR